MLPRRFALIRHVDYSGVAGTGVIAYGVAFDDGQVVLRWSSAHRATSVLDSVEDLIAAHGHGEATSIEWIDAPPGKDDAPAQQQGGRRARRPAAQAPQLPPAPADAGHTTAPVPVTPAQPGAHPATPVVTQPAEQSTDQAPAQPAAGAPAANAFPSSTSNGAAHMPSAAQPDDADVIDHPAAARGTEDERRARHGAIATQPMNADLSEDRGPRRVPPTHESPRSIFEEAEEPERPDLRLASSNGRSRDLDDADDSGGGSPGREPSAGFFPTGHQHLETVTGLLDLPAGLNRRGRAASTDQDAFASRRNGRHRGD